MTIIHAPMSACMLCAKVVKNTIKTKCFDTTFCRYDKDFATSISDKLRSGLGTLLIVAHIHPQCRYGNKEGNGIGERKTCPHSVYAKEAGQNKQGGNEKNELA